MGQKSERIAVYPGSFDPITFGHVDLVERGLRLFDRLIVAVARNPRKQTLFTVDERLDLIRGATTDLTGLEVTSFEGLLVEHVKEQGAQSLLRGLRSMSDFEYEFQFAHMNRRLAPTVETVFMAPAEEHFFVSSSLVKEVAAFGGDLDRLVPPNVAAAMRAKYAS